MLTASILADEENKRRNRERESGRRARKLAKVRAKRLRRVAIFPVSLLFLFFLLLIALVARGSSFIISIILSGPGIGPLNSVYGSAKDDDKKSN